MKGLFSLDSIIAILLMLFLVLWSQGFVSMSFDNANSFGVSYETKAEAIRVGSLMNTFFSTAPSSSDYYTLPTANARLFKNSTASFSIVKAKSGNLVVYVQNKFFSVNSSYGVANVSYNSTTGRVTA